MSHRISLQPDAEPFPGVRLVQLRGRGGFAEVWEARDTTGGSLAIKFMTSDKTSSTAREIKSLTAMGALSHPGLMGIHRICSIPGYVVVVMELAEGSILDFMEVWFTEYHRSIDAEVLLNYLRPVASALDYLNSHQHQHQRDARRVGYQHCDIKPSNLLLVDDRLKIADFGLVTATTGSLTPCQKSGTLDFSSPEMHRGMLSDRSDQFSLAVSYYFLRSGWLPFPAPPDGFTRSMSYRRPSADLSHISSEEAGVLERALDLAPERRYESSSVLLDSLCEALNLETGEDSHAEMTAGSGW